MIFFFICICKITCKPMGKFDEKLNLGKRGLPPSQSKTQSFGIPSCYFLPLISKHWIGNDLFDCEVTRPPSCRVECTQKRSVHPTRAYYNTQCFDDNRSKEPIKYVFSLFISDNSLLLKLSMRKISNSINKSPGEHVRKYFSK